MYGQKSIRERSKRLSLNRVAADKHLYRSRSIYGSGGWERERERERKRWGVGATTMLPRLPRPSDQREREGFGACVCAFHVRVSVGWRNCKPMRTWVMGDLLFLPVRSRLLPGWGSPSPPPLPSPPLPCPLLPASPRHPPPVLAFTRYVNSHGRSEQNTDPCSIGRRGVCRLGLVVKALGW